MAALLQHQPSGLDAQVLDRFSWRLTRLGAECTAKLARTEMRRIRELRNRQRLVEIALRKCKCTLDTIGFGFQLKQCRKLRLATSTPAIDHQMLGHCACVVRAPIVF